jgi:hypothetical protein
MNGTGGALLSWRGSCKTDRQLGRHSNTRASRSTRPVHVRSDRLGKTRSAPPSLPPLAVPHRMARAREWVRASSGHAISARIISCLFFCFPLCTGSGRSSYTAFLWHVLMHAHPCLPRSLFTSQSPPIFQRLIRPLTNVLPVDHLIWIHLWSFLVYDTTATSPGGNIKRMHAPAECTRPDHAVKRCVTSRVKKKS